MQHVLPHPSMVEASRNSSQFNRISRPGLRLSKQRLPVQLYGSHMGKTPLMPLARLKLEPRKMRLQYPRLEPSVLIGEHQFQ